MNSALHESAGARPGRLPALVLVVSLPIALLVSWSSPLAAQEPPAPPAADAEEPAKSGTADSANAGAKAGEASAPAEPAAEAEEVPADGGMSAATAPEARGGVVQQLEAGSGVRVQTMCTNCNQANLTINGVTGSDHVLVTLDGMPAVGGLGTAYVLTQIPTEFIGYSHVARGPGSVLSGPGGMGGSIDFHTAERTTDRRVLLDAVVGDWASKTLRLGGTERWGPVGAMVFAQAVKQNAVESSGDGANDTPEFERYTYQGLFDFHLTDRQVITVGDIHYGENQIAGPGASLPREDTALEENAKFNWRQQRLGYRWDAQSGLQLTFDANYSRRVQWQESAPAIDAPLWRYLRVSDERSAFKLQAKKPMGKAGLLTGGVEYSKLQLNVNNLETFFTPHITDGLEHFGAYAEWEQSVGSKWNWSGGLRYADFIVYGWSQPRNGTRRLDPDLPSSYLLPRAKVAYRPSTKLLFSFGTGRTAVAPTPVFEKTCCGARYARSREVSPERSWSWQAQAEWHPTPDMRVTGTLFQTDFDDYILRAVKTETRAVPEYANVNITRARVRGIDLVHDMRFAGNRYNVGWTYGYSDPQDGDGNWLPFLPRQTASAYFRFDHERWRTKVNFDIRWQGSLLHYRLSVDARPNSPPVGFRQSEDFMTADVTFEHPLGDAGWVVHGGVTNITDYVMSDLTIEDEDGSGEGDQFERCYDWGPLTGRYAFVGFKFTR